MPIARRVKNEPPRRIWRYVERCGLQRNTADERFSTNSQAKLFSNSPTTTDPLSLTLVLNCLMPVDTS